MGKSSRRTQEREATKKVWADQKKTYKRGRLGIILAAVVVGVAVSISAAQFVKSYFPSYQELSIDDSATLKRVFFSGDPWLVVCHTPDNPQGKGSGATTSLTSDRLLELVGEAAGKLTDSGIQTGIVDCTAALSNGQNIIQRFKLSDRKKPLLFAVANGDRPSRIDSKLLKTPGKLAARVKAVTAPQFMKMSSAADLRKCTKQKSCVVLWTDRSDASIKYHFTDFLKSNRTTRFGVLHKKPRAPLQRHLAKTLGLPKGMAALLRFDRGKCEVQGANTTRLFVRGMPVTVNQGLALRDHVEGIVTPRFLTPAELSYVPQQWEGEWPDDDASVPREVQAAIDTLLEDVVEVEDSESLGTVLPKGKGREDASSPRQERADADTENLEVEEEHEVKDDSPIDVDARKRMEAEQWDHMPMETTEEGEHDWEEDDVEEIDLSEEDLHESDF